MAISNRQCHSRRSGLSPIVFASDRFFRYARWVMQHEAPTNAFIRIKNWVVLVSANAVLHIVHRRAVSNFRERNGYWPNIANPGRYEERMLWRKVVDHNPEFVVFSDKLAAKDYTNRVCPELALPKTLWVGEDADEIPDECLTGDVFVKTNHGWNYNHRVSAGIVDRAELKTKADRWLRTTHGKKMHEWAYSQVRPKLFVEEAIGDASVDLLEFNLRASNGTVILSSVIGYNKLPNKWTVYLDGEGRPTQGVDDDETDAVPQLPEGIEIMVPFRQALSHAKELSVGVDYARYDFMWNGKDLYGGEITIYPAAGNGTIENAKLHNKVLAEWDLGVSHFLSSQQTGFKRLYAKALKDQLKA